LTLYDSLPSVSIYRVDDRAFLSFFLHGQLAVKSPRIQVHGRDSIMRRLMTRELETLWQIGTDFTDITQWQTEMQSIGENLGVA